MNPGWRRLRVWQVGLLLALATGLGGCAAHGLRRPAADPVAQWSVQFQTSLRDARSEGRREGDSLLGVYQRVPADFAPGLARLRADVLEARSRAADQGRNRLSAEEVDRLTVRNPHFWHAWFEFHPRDCSLLMLHASLLMEAGELFRASMVLSCGVQAATFNSQERRFWLVQQARAHWTLSIRLNEFEASRRACQSQPQRWAATLEAARIRWPQDGFAVEGQLRVRAGVGADAGADARDVIVLTAAGRQAATAELERLRQLSPIAAARYGEDVAAAVEFGRLWEHFSDEEQPLEDRTLLGLAEQARTLGLPELAMVARRLVVARRGFFAPADLEPTGQLLQQFLPAAGAAAIMARFEEASLPGLRLTKPEEEAGELLPGMDPLIHPLYAVQAVREIARETLWIDAAGSNNRMRAGHLRQRALRNTNVGRYAAALDDLDAALKLYPKETAWLIERAVVLAKAGREADAEAGFAHARRLPPTSEDDGAFSLAVFRLRQGRYAEAESLFRAQAQAPEHGPYALIFGYLAGLRRGAPDRAWLQANRLTKADWPAPLHRYLLGETDRRGLLEAARDSSDLRMNEQQCEAFFVLGMVALAAGDPKGAERELENCVQSGIVGFIEYDLATQELARLRPVSPAPPARVAPEARPAKEAARQGDGGLAAFPAMTGGAGA